MNTEVPPELADLTQVHTPLPPEAVHELVLNVDDKDERMWIPFEEGATSEFTRPFVFSIVTGSWVLLLKATAADFVMRHYHPAPVTGYTLAGT